MGTKNSKKAQRKHGCVGVSIVPLGFLSGLRKWSLQVPYSQCSESQLRSPPLILEHLPCPRPGIVLEIATTTSPLSAVDFHSFAWPSGYFSCPSPDLTSPPFQVPSLHLPPMTILFPLLSEIEASLLGPLFLFSFFGSVECNVVPAFSANIHLQVGTYHARLFQPVFPHSG